MLLWMLYSVLVTAFIGLVAVAGERIAGLIGAPRRAVWAGALLAAIVATTVAWGSPAGRRPTTRLSSAVTTVSDRALEPVQRVSQRVSMRSSSAISASPLLARMLILPAVWLALSAMVTLLLVMSWLHLRRRQRLWSPARFGGEDVVVSDGLGPAVVGFFHPIIALPPWVMTDRDDRIALIIAHEREHVRAGDQRALALAWLAVVALPWNPVIAWMMHRLRQAIEIDCDARVVRRCPDWRAYGELLIEVSCKQEYWRTGLTAFAEQPSTVERRIIALTGRMPRNRNAVITALTVAAAAVVLVACEIPRPTGPGVRHASEIRSAAPVAVDGPAALPAAAASEGHRILAREFPAVSAAGTAADQAVWFIADHDGSVISSWVGAPMSDQEFRRVAYQPAYDSLDLVVFTGQMQATNGAPIRVVWATDQEMWTGREMVTDRLRALLRDSIAVLKPELFGETPPGQSAYVSIDWKAHRIERIWSGPAFTDRKEQWEYARSQLPGRMVLRATNVTVTSGAGRPIPVVYLRRTAWTERY